MNTPRPTPPSPPFLTRGPLTAGEVNLCRFRLRVFADLDRSLDDLQEKQRKAQIDPYALEFRLKVDVGGFKKGTRFDCLGGLVYGLHGADGNNYEFNDTTYFEPVRKRKKRR